MRESIRHFASKNCLDIDGLGDKLVGQLIEEGLVKELDDIYRAHARANSPGLERMADKSAQNVLDQYQSVRATRRSIALSTASASATSASTPRANWRCRFKHASTR